ncbi:MAG: hypothetical protein H6774_04835 [Pseudomonadales bacterium]|nr:hypothetical protein [Pseudomonadales bacterium]
MSEAEGQKLDHVSKTKKEGKCIEQLEQHAGWISDILHRIDEINTFARKHKDLPLFEDNPDNFPDDELEISLKEKVFQQVVSARIKYCFDATKLLAQLGESVASDDVILDRSQLIEMTNSAVLMVSASVSDLRRTQQPTPEHLRAFSEMNNFLQRVIKDVSLYFFESLILEIREDLKVDLIAISENLNKSGDKNLENILTHLDSASSFTIPNQKLMFLVKIADLLGVSYQSQLGLSSDNLLERRRLIFSNILLRLLASQAPFPPDLASYILKYHLVDIESFIQGESFEASHAAITLEKLNAPQSLPVLLDYFSHSQGQHTSRFVARAFFQIALNNSEENTTSLIQLSERGKIVNLLVHAAKDETSLVHRYIKDDGEGYYANDFISDPEKYVARNAVVELLTSEGVDSDLIQTYFLHGDEDGNIEGILKNHIPELEECVMNFPFSFWRHHESFVTKMLASHQNEAGEYTFPLNIFSQYTDDEHLQTKINSMYKKKDLANGHRARVSMVFGFLYGLRGKEEARTITMLVGQATDSKNGVRQLRKIFELVNALDSLGAQHIDLGEDIRSSEENIKTQLITMLIEIMDIGNDDAYKALLTKNIETLTQSVLLEIVVKLFSSFTAKQEFGAIKIFKEAFFHHLEGSFSDFKFDRSRSAFLSKMTADQYERWLKEEEEPFSLVDSVSDEQNEQFRLETVKRFVEEMIYHAKQSDDQSFVSAVETLGRNIAESSSSKDAKEKFTSAVVELRGVRDRQFLADKQAIEDIFNQDNLAKNNESYKIVETKGMQDRPSAKNNESYKIVETTNFMDLLNSGVEPVETCQSWNNGLYSECLPTTVENGTIKLIQIRNERNEIIGRVIVRVMEYAENYGEEPQLCLFIEPEYLREKNYLLAKKMHDYCISLGSNLELPVFFSQRVSLMAGENSSEKNLWVSLQGDNIGPYYSDSLGGKITRMYHPISTACFSLSPTPTPAPHP